MSKIRALKQGFAETHNKTKGVGLSGLILWAIVGYSFIDPINVYLRGFMFIIGSYFVAYMFQEVISKAIAYKMIYGDG